ncbi:hypothetical protein Bca52824_079813 [Brassica carinata]|uniref:SBP-type domain-containing protein n=1 Tax=Brassica carinata TaxID=52824 RepID=A0A8X7U0G9_BRACI|nr:hypothetical protein Bca52824_079813 [Brassica carinata]
MLDYEWDNPSAIMVSGEDRHDLDPTRALSIFDPTQTNHHQSSSYNNFSPPLFSSLSNQQHLTVVYGHQQTAHHHIPTNQFHHSFYDANNPYASSSDSIYHAHHPSASALFSFDQTGPGSGSSYNFLVPKTEVDVVSHSTSNRIGLNLGGRTYFSAGDDDDFVSRLYRRSRHGEMLGMGNSLSTPRCQAERCNADLTHAKHYHRRHKVCEFHSKASTVVAAGLSQRFCQQCSRFHLLSEFDNGKRSCRKRLADHNRRRRKCHQSASANGKHTPNIITAPNSANDSSVKSSSASPSNAPTPISLECFRQTTASSSTSALWGSLAPTYNI